VGGTGFWWIQTYSRIRRQGAQWRHARVPGHSWNAAAVIVTKCKNPTCFNALPCATHPRFPNSTIAKLYASHRWRIVSTRHRIEEPLCRVCKSQGRMTPAKITDHIIAIRDGGAIWDEENLQSLCRQCDQRKRQRVQQRSMA